METHIQASAKDPTMTNERRLFGVVVILLHTHVGLQNVGVFVTLRRTRVGLLNCRRRKKSNRPLYNLNKLHQARSTVQTTAQNPNHCVWVTITIRTSVSSVVVLCAVVVVVVR